MEVRSRAHLKKTRSFCNLNALWAGCFQNLLLQCWSYCNIEHLVINVVNKYDCDLYIIDHMLNYMAKPTTAGSKFQSVPYKRSPFILSSLDF